MQPTVVERQNKTTIDARKLKAEIDQTPNATDEEEAAKAKVDEAVTTKNAIDQATNNELTQMARFNQQCATNVVKKDEAQ